MMTRGPCRSWGPLAVAAALALAWCCQPCQGHGRLMEPPSRSSMWRMGFRTQKNYNDNELFCGGYAVQWQRNSGKCGVCGDPWSQPNPRDNEAGGKYAKGIIVRRYKRGQVMNAMVQLTANHRGYFEFRLCPVNDSSVAATDECMAKHPLKIADDSTGSTRFMVDNGRAMNFNISLQLPKDMTCSQCVFQWSYTAGNNWGRCENGSSKVGCGPQETFRGCADISISDEPVFYSSDDDDDVPPSQIPPQTTRRTATNVPWWKTTYATAPRRHYTSAPRFTSPRTTPRPHHEVESRHPAPSPPFRGGHPNSHPGGSHPDDREVEGGHGHRHPGATTEGYDHEDTPTRGYPGVFKPVRPVGPGFGGKIPSYAPGSGGKVPAYGPAFTLPPRTMMPRRYTPKGRVTYRFKPTTVVSFKTTKKVPKVPPATKPPVTKTVGGCKSVGTWRRLPGMDKWCWENCTRGYCPPTHCACY
ncbi:uncharacterized protein ISCGN_020932 [Ixodes scapularis]